jgi:hypothetical protein
MNPPPFAILRATVRDTRTSERRIKRNTTGRTPGVLDHGRIREFGRQSRDLQVLELHLPIVPVGEDRLEMLVKAAPIRVPEHVVAEHVREVVEAACPGHAIVVVGARLVVPVVQPAAVELVQDFLFGGDEIGVMVLCFMVC